MTNHNPQWLKDMGYEEGDDLADFDAFECDICHHVFDIDDSVAGCDEYGRVYLCPGCAR